MKGSRLLIALALIVAVVVACTTMKGLELTGKWQTEDGSKKIEFTKDGKLNLADGPATITAPFKIQDKQTLLVDLGMLGTTTLKYALEKDSLAITDSKGAATKFVRVKEGQEAKQEAPKPQVKQEVPKPQQEAAKAPQEAPKAQPEPAKK